MNNKLRDFISYFKLFAFYNRILPIKALYRESLNVIIKNYVSFPLTVNMLITNKCNFFCKMCSFKNLNNINAIDNKEELSIDNLERFIVQVKPYHPLIHIGGGEPFTRHDLLDIIKIIKSNKLKCLITTNGSLIDEETIEKIVKLGVDGVIFSLYGWGIVHDEITGVKGSFKKIEANFKLLLSRKTNDTKVFLSSLPLPDNINALKQLVQNAYAIGVDGVKIEQLNFLSFNEYKHSRDYKGKFNLRPSTFIRESHFSREFTDELQRVYKEIQNAYKNFVFIKPYLTDAQLVDWYSSAPFREPKCSFMSHSIFLNYNGDIIPCQFLPQCILGNVKKDSLKDIWNSAAREELRDEIHKAGPIICMRCCKN